MHRGDVLKEKLKYIILMLVKKFYPLYLVNRIVMVISVLFSSIQNIKSQTDVS